ncbi:MAG TPA: hypothetical protein PKW55_05950 [Spirochaetota bacterium]|nr:hypothetical protein [Spirochaetota bacterium]HOM38427.1 hypothetical protein [Spirochaetota bacterium]HPQ48966.1 hypothetical protein [Spirochaetota bacterium]
MRKYFLLLLIAISLFINRITYSFTWAEIEGGIVYTGYNDVRIPSDSGTMFSLKDDIKSDNTLFYRIRLGYNFGASEFILLFAPLKVEGDGIINKNIYFNGKTFYSFSYLKSLFKFNSYRFTYRYEIYSDSSIILKLGLTAKIRDAKIRLEDNTGNSAERSNLGFVPLVNLFFQFFLFNNSGVILEGDALVAPQGRAEDFFVGLFYNISKDFSFKLGYRMLEGGSDGGGNVYTFSMFNYLSLCFTYNF